jgi:hypothetical protein
LKLRGAGGSGAGCWCWRWRWKRMMSLAKPRTTRHSQAKVIGFYGGDGRFNISQRIRNVKKVTSWKKKKKEKNSEPTHTQDSLSGREGRMDLPVIII